jgi:hypothetical protein
MMSPSNSAAIEAGREPPKIDVDVCIDAGLDPQVLELSLPTKCGLARHSSGEGSIIDCGWGCGFGGHPRSGFGP